MNRIDMLQLRRIGYFCTPPLGELEEELGWHGKNRRYLDGLVEEAEDDFHVRIEIFEELERLAGRLFENAPASPFCWRAFARKGMPRTQRPYRFFIGSLEIRSDITTVKAMVLQFPTLA